MKHLLIRSATITVLSIVASFAIVLLVISATGGALDGRALLLSVLCPTLIAFPTSLYTYLQKSRLRAALDALKKAHDDLAAAHRDLGEMHAKLSEKARRDNMTGLLNREAFLAAIEKTGRKSDKGALLIIDADNFKTINDNFGHMTGDEALLLICASIERSLRQDDLIGRIGGEEFGVFLPGAGQADATEAANRIRRAVESIVFMPPEAGPIRLTVSIGATLTRQETTLSDLLREADKRLYEAKRRGRNRVIFSPGVPEAA